MSKSLSCFDIKVKTYRKLPNWIVFVSESSVLPVFKRIFLTRDGTCISCIGRQILYHWATREAPATEFWLVLVATTTRRLKIILAFGKRCGKWLWQPSSIPAWRISRTERRGRLLSIGLPRAGHDWSNLACTHGSTNEDFMSWNIFLRT